MRFRFGIPVGIVTPQRGPRLSDSDLAAWQKKGIAANYPHSRTWKRMVVQLMSTRVADNHAQVVGS